MSRTQTGTFFTLTQSGTLRPGDPNFVGAAWTIVGPPVHLVTTGQIQGDWVVAFRMTGPAREVYGWRDNWPFPLNGNQGLWNMLAEHSVRDLVAEIDAVGPDGRLYQVVYTYDDWADSGGRVPYLARLIGEDIGTWMLRCGVSGDGFHQMTARLFDQVIPWQPFQLRIEDQATGPTGQFAEVSVTATGARVTCVSGLDERFNAVVENNFETPLNVRVVIPARNLLGEPTTGRKVHVLFGPLLGTSHDLKPSEIERYLYTRTTPVDEVFRFPLYSFHQSVRVEHAFLNGFGGSPEPPFPRTYRWGSTARYSALQTVGVAFDHAEFGLESLRPIDHFFQPLGDHRNWPKNQFHTAAEVTDRTVATLRVAPNVALPAVTWGSSDGGIVIDGELRADGLRTFRAAINEEFRPYRYLEVSTQLTLATTVRFTIEQFGHRKTWLISAAAGEQTWTVDLAFPTQIEGQSPSGIWHRSERGLDQPLRRRFDGIGRATALEIQFADSFVQVPILKLLASEGDLRWLGDPLPGTADDPLHVATGQIDGLDAFRVPWTGFLSSFLERIQWSHRVELSGPDLSMPASFADRYPTWDTVPWGFWHFHHLGLNQVRPTWNPLEPTPVTMTLRGMGYHLHTGISQDQIFDGEEPFVCFFDVLEGPGVTATSLKPMGTGGTIRLRAERPGRSPRAWNVTGHRLESPFPWVPPTPPVLATLRLTEPSVASGLSLNLAGIRQVVAVAALPPDSPPRLHLTRHQLGHTIETRTTDERVEIAPLLEAEPGEPQVVRQDPVSAIFDAQTARLLDNTLFTLWSESGHLFQTTSQAEGRSWTEPTMITEGSELALATCPLTGISLLAVWHQGTWFAHRLSSGTWQPLGPIVDADAARAGLAFTADAGNAAVFSVPIDGEIRRFESVDLGQSWQEVA